MDNLNKILTQYILLGILCGGYSGLIITDLLIKNQPTELSNPQIIGMMIGAAIGFWAQYSENKYSKIHR